MRRAGWNLLLQITKQEKNTKKWKKCLTNEDECGILLSVAENESCENNKLKKVIDRHEMMWYTLKVAAEKLQQKSLKKCLTRTASYDNIYKLSLEQQSKEPWQMNNVSNPENSFKNFQKRTKTLTR